MSTPSSTKPDEVGHRRAGSSTEQASAPLAAVAAPQWVCAAAGGAGVIRVGFLDDHPAVRIGIESILRRTSDLLPVGGASSAADLWELIERAEPDVVILDFHHPGQDGLKLCLQIKAQEGGPRVVLYSARDDALMVAATLAGVDGIVGKSSDAARLLEVIRAVAAGQVALPMIDPALKRRAAGELDPADHAILSMRVAGNTPAEIADTLWIDRGQLADRTTGMIARLLGGDRRADTRELGLATTS